MFKDLEALAKKKPADITYAMLAPLHVFGWLLSGNQREHVRKWTKGLALAAKRRMEEHAPGAASSSSKMAKKAPCSSDAKAVVAALFAKK